MPQFSFRPLLAGVILAAAHGSVVCAAEPEFGMQADANNTLDFSTSNTGLTVREGDILSGPRLTQRGIGVRNSVLVWEDGIVPYYIAPELDSYLDVIVQSAINTWNSVAGITLVKIDPRSWDAPDDYLHFVPAQGCASWVGRQGGAQAVWTGPGCTRGSMMHEIGHALGLEHEHTRPDRDQYISINWDNIDPDKADNFGVSDSNRRNYGPYDYASIMHYGEYFFSVNNQPTIKPLMDNAIEIGQRIAPSPGDIQAISILYGSDISLVSHVESDGANTEVNLLVSNEHFQGANMLEISMHIGTAQLMSNSNPDWDCFTYDGTLSCSRERLAAAEQSSIDLEFDQVFSESDLTISLGSKTPDANLANNGGTASAPAALAANQPDRIMPLSDQHQQANLGAENYSLGGLGLLLALRLMRRQRMA